MSGAGAAEGAGTPGGLARAVVRVAGGNFIEMYDFMVFGYFAGAIGRAFFPARDPYASLMLALTTFGAGFLMRPLGAVVLGGYADRRGRRAGLILTLSLMAAGVLSLALAPPAALVGPLAPAIVLAGRLLQGFSAGAELGSVSVYLAEIAPPGRRGFWVAWQSASQQVAVVVAAALGFLLNRALAPADLDAWGWRVPLLLGAAIVPVIFLLRRGLAESPAFRPPPRGEGLRLLARRWPALLAGVALVTMTTVSFYMITAYTPTFGGLLRLDPGLSLLVTLAVGASNLLWLPAFGALSDRVGRRPILLAAAGAMALGAYPLLLWLAAVPSIGRLLLVELVLSLLYGAYNGAMVPFLAEAAPGLARATGFSLAYALATALFGGYTPAVSTLLVHRLGPAAPGLWLALAGLSGVLGALLSRPDVEDGPRLSR